MSTLADAYRALNPARPLAGDLLASSYVNRPGDPIDLLGQELTLADTPLHALVVGQRGIGKSTELANLAWLLNKHPAALPLPILIDLPFSPEGFSVGQTIAAIVDALVQAKDQIRGGPSWQSATARLESRIILSQAREDSHASNNLMVLNELLEKLPESSRRPVVLFDGAERLENKEFLRLLHAVRQIKCSVVAVAPMGILFEERYAADLNEWGRVVVLPAVSVFTPEGQPDEQGRAILRSVLEKRAGVGAFDPAALDTLIPASGGIHRDLLTLAQDACRRAFAARKPSVSVAEARAAVAELRHQRSFQLTPVYLRQLRHFVDDPRGGLDATVAEPLKLNMLVSYRADWTWLAVHPLLWPRLELVPRAEAS